VASVTPSGQALAQRMAAPIPARGKPVVVELGPGTGAFSATIQTVLAGRGRHIAIDLSERFTAFLMDRFPGLDAVTADAGEVAAVLSTFGLDQADVIVSGLPWAAIGRVRQLVLLDAMVDVLAPGGPSRRSPTSTPGGPDRP
jgi:phosphatidylethanolamine/phosphatidyl-N-methylethanolamine N-methyltransferase